MKNFELYNEECCLRHLPTYSLVHFLFWYLFHTLIFNSIIVVYHFNHRFIEPECREPILMADSKILIFRKCYWFFFFCMSVSRPVSKWLFLRTLKGSARKSTAVWEIARDKGSNNDCLKNPQAPFIEQIQYKKQNDSISPTSYL